MASTQIKIHSADTFFTREEWHAFCLTHLCGKWTNRFNSYFWYVGIGVSKQIRLFMRSDIKEVNFKTWGNYWHSIYYMLILSNYCKQRFIVDISIYSIMTKYSTTLHKTIIKWFMIMLFCLKIWPYYILIWNFCLLKDILEISQSLHGLICLFLQVKRAKLNHQLSSMYRETNMKLHFFSSVILSSRT